MSTQRSDCDVSPRSQSINVGRLCLRGLLGRVKCELLPTLSRATLWLTIPRLVAWICRRRCAVSFLRSDLQEVVASRFACRSHVRRQALLIRRAHLKSSCIKSMHIDNCPAPLLFPNSFKDLFLQPDQSMRFPELVRPLASPGRQRELGFSNVGNLVGSSKQARLARGSQRLLVASEVPGKIVSPFRVLHQPQTVTPSPDQVVSFLRQSLGYAKLYPHVQLFRVLPQKTAERPLSLAPPPASPVLYL